MKHINDTPRRFPRTLYEAFPRSPHWIDERTRPIDKPDMLVIVGTIVILGVTLVLTWVL